MIGSGRDYADAVRARLAFLAGLKDGWWNGDGVAPTQLALDAALEVAIALLTLNPQWRFGLFPTIEGGIQAERMICPWAIEILFAAHGAVSAKAYDLLTDEERAVSFVADADAPAAILAWVKAIWLDYPLEEASA